MPWNGPRHSPRMISASARRASASARSGVKRRNALSLASWRSMRSIRNFEYSTGESFRARRSSAASATVSQARSLIVRSRHRDGIRERARRPARDSRLTGTPAVLAPPASRAGAAADARPRAGSCRLPSPSFARHRASSRHQPLPVSQLLVTGPDHGSPSAKYRRPLLHESPDPFLGVLGAPADALGESLDLQGGAQTRVLIVDRPLGELYRHRRTCRNLRRKPDGCSHELSGFDYGVYDAELQRFGGIDGVPGKNQLAGLRRAHDARQEPGTAPVRSEPAFDEGLGKFRRARGDTDIARER